MGFQKQQQHDAMQQKAKCKQFTFSLFVLPGFTFDYQHLMNQKLTKPHLIDKLKNQNSSTSLDYLERLTKQKWVSSSKTLITCSHLASDQC